MQEQAQVLSKYPVALPSDGDYSNADVYTKVGTRYLKSGIKCKLPNGIIEKMFFIGVTEVKDEDSIVSILSNEGGIIHKCERHYCLKCNVEIRGNLTHAKRHIESEKHERLSKVFLPSEVKQIAVAWFTRHHLSFNAISDPLIHILIPGLTANTQFSTFLQHTLSIVQSAIINELNDAEFISVAADGWRTADGRKVGVAFHSTAEGSVTNTYFVALRNPPANTLGSDEISSIVKEVCADYKLDADKLVAFVSDSAADMQATANKPGLDWDRCVIHIVSNMIEEMIDLLPERFEKLHSNASVLRKSARWIEFFNNIYKIGKDKYENHTNFSVSVPTRWASRLAECLDILYFEDAIIEYYNHEGINNNLPQHIMQSDFEMLKELEPVFAFILATVKNLQDQSLNWNIANVYVMVLQIADCLNEFIEHKRQERTEKQEEMNTQWEQDKSQTRIRIPESHIVPPVEVR